MIFTIFGRRGSGKTTAIRALISDDAKLQKPVVVIDVLGNFQPDYPDDCYGLVDGLEALKNGVDLIVHVPEDPARSVDYFAALLWQKSGGTLVIDEIDSISWKEAPCLGELVRFGRNRNLWLVAGARRPAEVPKHLTAGTDLYMILATHEPRDVEYHEKSIGDEALGSEIRKLPRFTGLWLDQRDGNRGNFTVRDGRILFSKRPNNPID